MTVPPHNPDGEPGDEELAVFRATVEKAWHDQVINGASYIKRDLATGGIVNSDRSHWIGEHTDCHLPPLGIESPLSKMLTDATSLEIHWPEALKARRDKAISAGYSDSTTISYWAETKLGEPTPAPTTETILAAIRKVMDAAADLPVQPRAWRMHPDDIDSIPRTERPLPWQDPTAALGTPVIPDNRVPAGWMVSDDIIRDLDGDYRYRFDDWPYDPQWSSKASTILTGGRTPADADSSEDDPSTDGRDDLSADWNKPEPSHWCAGWALALLLAVVGGLVIVAAAVLVTLAAMLGWLG